MFITSCGIIPPAGTDKKGRQRVGLEFGFSVHRIHVQSSYDVTTNHLKGLRTQRPGAALCQVVPELRKEASSTQGSRVQTDSNRVEVGSVV
jgi:hypothetical protein